MIVRRLLLATLPLALVACATTGTGNHRAAADAAPDAAPASTSAEAPRKVSPYAPAQEDPSKRGDYVAGGLFRPGVPDAVPDEIPDVDAIPEPEVREEPLARTGNRDYVVLGRRYHVLDSAEGYAQEGEASYYGKKFHGRKTSSGEVYDMYAFTAAHRTLPLPSYVRVTNLDNGRSIVVRVNDRGPFHSRRIIDLSYAAAVKLGYRQRGTARVRVEALVPDDDAQPAAPQVASTSGMDRLVADLPAPAASTPQAAPGSGAQPDGNRFYMQQGGRTMTAEEFDRWMAARGIQVATGRPTVIATTARAAAPAATSVPAVASPASSPAPAAAPSPEQGSAPGDAVTLQVASFTDESNARRALSLLQRAEIRRARLLAAEVSGRHIWRLRIGPVEVDNVAELVARIEGLGLGRPQRVVD